MADSKDILEKRDQLGKLWEAQKALNDKVLAEKREYTAEENAEYEKREADLARLDEEINAHVTREQRSAEIAARGEKVKEATSRGIRPEVRSASNKTDTEMVPSKLRSRWDADVAAAWERRANPAYEAAFRSYLSCADARTMNPDEQRALSVGTANAGGYTVPTQEFVAELLKAVDDATPTLQLARTFDVPQAQSLGVPTLQADPADGDWTSEIATGSEDSTMAFGLRELRPNPIAKLLKVSKKLMRASPLGMENIVRDRLAYKIAIPLNKGVLTGSGASQPLGIFTASASGISTGRDVTVSTTSALDADKLITAKYTLRAGYMPTWILHRTTLAAIRKLKATTGDYVWMPGLTQGAPSILLDHPVQLDENAPSFSTTGGSYVAVLGDMSFYWVARALNFEIQRLDELYAASNQVGFIVRAELDGMPVIEDAFVRCVM